MNDTLRTLVLPLAQSYLRHAVAGWGMWLLQAGLVNTDQEKQFEGAVMLLAMLAWTTWDKWGRAIFMRQFAKMISHVDAIPPIGPSASPGQVAAAGTAITAAKAAAAAAPVLALAIVVALLMASPSAQAAGLVKPSGNLANDMQAVLHPGETPLLTGDPVADLHSAMKKGGSKLIMHLKRQYALAIAPLSDGAGPIDPIAAPCAKALVPIVDLVVNGPKATAVAAGDPMALTADEQTAAADTDQIDGIVVQVEKLRILRIAVQSPALTIACGPLVQDEVKQSKNLMGGLTSLITGTGLLAPIAGL